MSTDDTARLVLELEAILFCAGKPLTEAQILKLYPEDSQPEMADLKQALSELQQHYESRGVELVKIASGYQFQSKVEYAPTLASLWEEKPARYSRALLETLAIIAYRQPITRAEIEEIRGVSISASIFKTLTEEREWIRVVGHKDVPGRPGLYATTKGFLNYFGLASLEQLPTLPEIFNLGLESESENDKIPEDSAQLELAELDS